MTKKIDIDLLLTPLAGENPSGEDLRYTQVYDDIKEARRADDPFSMGEWQREIKYSDWDAVVSISLEALEKRSKDLQIAAWLTEALTLTGGFKGFSSGIALLSGLLRDFWDTVYPEVEEGDLEFRIAPLEFLNEKLSEAVKMVPLTDPESTPGYSWLKWQESREVGSDADTKNKYGDYDEQKRTRRSELMAEGKIPAEEFDTAVAKNSPQFSKALLDDLDRALVSFRELDALVDESFGNEAPRLSDLGQALEECSRLVTRLAPDLKAAKEAPAPVSPPLSPESAAIEEPSRAGETVIVAPRTEAVQETTPPSVQPAAAVVGRDFASQEDALWREAVRKMEEGGFREALDNLLSIANSQPSERGRNRYRLLVAKLCVRAERFDLARPIIEQLSALIGELQLERWESPLWISEVLEVLYQCLTSGEPSDEDSFRARELFTRICTMDVTKALVYRK